MFVQHVCTGANERAEWNAGRHAALQGSWRGESVSEFDKQTINHDCIKRGPGEIDTVVR